LVSERVQGGFKKKKGGGKVGKNLIFWRESQKKVGGAAK